MENQKCPHCGSYDCKDITNSKDQANKVLTFVVDLGSQMLSNFFGGGGKSLDYNKAYNRTHFSPKSEKRMYRCKKCGHTWESR